ncbi:TonB-dependent receptor plug domain-containing protein [Parahaliea maris]|uniref:TonB-dependent receptor plug domain-containing protein n=1 Tax=Parahaliea maris TaxID=2716870 RepID=A0A5C8ZYA7_9GAMM|nr:TonB-dependent receptor plug domain-containing protein [Parahaliea maris]TXS92779.1 TonB-dependent receptor plug domain-containing protein [Parahaliea maris]
MLLPKYRLQTYLAPNPLALAISLLAAPAALPALAQGGALEEVVVTAQKREQSSQETPISISALSASNIENRAIRNTEDLIGQLPGVAGFSAPGSRGATSLAMRGVAGGNPANLSLDPSVGMYLDGVYIGKANGSAMDVAEIERIEVLRGPQGTLYGRNSTAGAVNVITRKPSGEFGLRATAKAGNYNFREFKLNMDLPSVGTSGEGLGELSASVGYQTRLRDGLYDNNSPGGDDFDELDRQSWRAAINWNITDSFYVDYVYDHSELDEAGALQQVVGFTPVDAAGNVSRIAALQGTLAAAQGMANIPGADPRISSRWIPSLQQTIAAYQNALERGEGRADDGLADFTPRSDNTVDGHSLTLTWEAGDLGALGDVTFKSITGYREVETNVFGDIEDLDSRLDSNGVGAYSDLVQLTMAQIYGAEIGFLGAPVGAFAGMLWDGIDNLGAFHTKQNTFTGYEQFSEELQMIGSTDRLEYVLGAYYFEDEGEYRRNAIFAAPLNGAGAQYYDNATDAWAGFAHATWTPGWLDERLSLTAGLRYTEEEKEIDYDYKEFATPFGFNPARAVSRAESFSNTSGTFTVAFQATEDINTFIRYSTGYRSGGFNGEIFDNGFDEETIEQLELGIKSDWWDRRLRINGSLYTYTYDDLQVSQIKTEGGAATSVITNSGKADRWGGELELLVSPLEDLVLGLSYSYIHGNYDKFPAVCGTNEPATCLPADDLAKRGSPSNQLNFTADYLFARTHFGDITGYVQANWQDAWYESALWTAVVGGEPVISPHQIMDERTVVDARLNLENIPLGNGSLRITAWGRNLTDDDYPTFSINFGTLGLISEQYGQPRTYGLEVSYQY